MVRTILIFFIGTGLLYAGAEALVRGAIRLAETFHIRPVIIGLTVVAFGTSMPEFMVSLISAIAGNSDIALGNVVGSNIANIGLILGLGAFLRPVTVGKTSFTIYLPVLFAATITLYLFSFSTVIGFLHGLVLLTGLVLFIYTVWLKRKRPLYTTAAIGTGSVDVSAKERVVDIVMVLGGSGLLLLGSHMMIDSGVSIAQAFGVSEFAIGVTLIAFGTSLPELAATIVSVIKRNTDIILGNIIGSNIFNVLFVVGGVSVIHPIAVDSSSRSYEFPVMILFTVVLLVMMRTGKAVDRTEAFLLLVGYIIFLYFLF